MAFPQFVLASASPARRQLLHSIGLEPIIQPSHFDEDTIQETDPETLVQALALAKAQAVANAITLGPDPIVVLGCDSVLAFQGEIHGKPADEAEAIARWQTMRGQSGSLLSGHALIDATTGKTLVRSRSTDIHFANVSDTVIRSYIATGEPMNCAGCFTLEGRGGALIEKIEGCYSNVIGLSLPLLREMMGEFGYDLTSIW